MSRINQCLKTGAKVLLTGESVVAKGDLYMFASPGHGVNLVLHYVTPHQSVILKDDEPWSPEYDAVFDTASQRYEEFLDIPGAQVMMIHAELAYMHPDIPKPEGYGARDARKSQIEDFIKSLAEGFGGADSGVDVKVLRINKDGKVEDLE